MGDANPFNGDGMVTAFRIKDGHCDMQMKYVMTHRLKAERAARRGLFGDYRNAFTDDASVKGIQRTVSNTNVVPHNGMLLAMKEDGPPYAMDPLTLETRQLWDWNGQMTATHSLRIQRSIRQPGSCSDTPMRRKAKPLTTSPSTASTRTARRPGKSGSSRPIPA